MNTLKLIINIIVETIREPFCVYDTYWMYGFKLLFTKFALNAIIERARD